jgi:hypothetical protein
MAPNTSPQPLTALDPTRDDAGLWYLCSRLRMYLELHGTITVDNWNNSVAASRELAGERDRRRANDKAKPDNQSVKK